MKKAIITLLTLFAVAMLCTVSAFAADAPAAPAAPTRVWYKLVNHDKVSLKWNAVSGKYTKVQELAKPSVTLRKLTAETQYTYAVTAFRNSGGNLTESAKSKATFTTPMKMCTALMTSPRLS